MVGKDIPTVEEVYRRLRRVGIPLKEVRAIQHIPTAPGVTFGSLFRSMLGLGSLEVAEGMLRYRESELRQLQIENAILQLRIIDLKAAAAKA